MSQRTVVTVELAPHPWFLEAALIDPVPSLARWKAHARRNIQSTHPGITVRFGVSEEVNREQEFRVGWDRTGDRPGVFTLGASVWSILHDLTKSDSWCVYRTFEAPAPVRVKRDPLTDDLDVGMERIRLDEAILREQEETGWTNAG